MPKYIKKWTDEELEYLHNHYNDEKELLVNYFKGRSWKSIIHKITNENLPRKNIIQRFSDEELDLLIENYHLKKEDIIKLFPNRSWDTLRKKMDFIGLPRHKGWHYWSDEEIEILLDCNTMEEAQLRLPERNKTMIYEKAKKLDISLIVYAWTDEELNILKNSYSNLNIDGLLKLLPERSKSAIYTMACKLDIEGPVRRKDIRDDLILHYYLEKDMYASHIAKILNTTTTTITNRLKKFNIQIRKMSYYAKSYADREALQEIRSSIEYKMWRDTVLERDRYTCQKCATKKCKYNVHHILNFAEHEELRVEPDNGIAFCEDCHIEFHKKYGYKNNTREQLDEYLDMKIISN